MDWDCLSELTTIELQVVLRACIGMCLSLVSHVLLHLSTLIVPGPSWPVVLDTYRELMSESEAGRERYIQDR